MRPSSPGDLTRSTPFGRLLRGLRVAAGLTQAELAQRAGLSAKAVGSLERGERRRPQPHTRRRLAAAVGLTDDQFVRRLQAETEAAESVGGPPAPSGHGLDQSFTNGERTAAWELYVELITRVAVADLAPGTGLLREALNSLYSLFETARDILKRHGDEIRAAEGGGALAELTTAILNQVLRPVLAEWHPLLLDHENRRPNETSPVEHERSWVRNEELRQVLTATRATLDDYVRRLAAVAGLHTAR